MTIFILKELCIFLFPVLFELETFLLHLNSHMFLFGTLTQLYRLSLTYQTKGVQGQILNDCGSLFRPHNTGSGSSPLTMNTPDLPLNVCEGFCPTTTMNSSYPTHDGTANAREDSPLSLSEKLCPG